MRIVVFSGSPKGETSVTLQYVRYIQKVCPQHQLEVEHVVPRIMSPLLRLPGLRRGFKAQINPMMIRPYQKLLED